MKSRAKITVVGAGQVGATAALYAVQKALGDVVLVDIVEGVPQGKALDMAEALGLYNTDVRVLGASSYEVTADSDVVVVTAGVPRKPGMSREDLLMTNAKIVRGVMEEVVKRSPQAMVVMVTNPLDVMTYLAYRVGRLDKRRIMGMAGVLDAARFGYFIAEALEVSVQDVRAMVLGSHGDTMVPLPQYTTVNGIPLTEWLPPDRIEPLVSRTRGGGAEIVNLLKQGSAFYAPAASAIAMVQSILRDERRVLPCCVKLEGEYGFRDIFLGVPVVLGRNGVERIVEVSLTEDQKAALANSARVVQAGIQEIDQLVFRSA